DRELLQGIGEVAGTRPARRRGVGDQSLGRLGHPALQQPPGHGGLLGRRLGRVGERAAQPVLGVEQPDHGEQLVADLLGGRGTNRDLTEPVAELGVRSPAGAAHYCAAPDWPTRLPCVSRLSRNRSTMRLCRTWSASDSPTIRLASSVASDPTSARSEISACCRSASIWACADSVIRRASASARSRISAMICAPCSRASSRIREDSCLASSSCARYCASTAWASACASSARLIPPWIASSRSFSVWMIRGSSIF